MRLDDMRRAGLMKNRRRIEPYDDDFFEGNTSPPKAGKQIAKRVSPTKNDTRQDVIALAKFIP